MSKGGKTHRGFLSEIGVGASQTLAGKGAGGGIQDQLRRSLLSSIVAKPVSGVQPVTYDWTFLLRELGLPASWNNVGSPSALAAGGWGIAVNLVVAELSGGTVADIGIYYQIDGEDAVEASGTTVTGFARLTNPTTVVVGYSSAIGVDFTGTLTASFSKLYDL